MLESLEGSQDWIDDGVWKVIPSRSYLWLVDEDRRYLLLERDSGTFQHAGLRPDRALVTFGTCRRRPEERLK